jgi:kynurenine formamidase
MSPRFVDLSQSIHDGMPGIRRRNADGTWREDTVRLRVTGTRTESTAGFESTEIAHPTAIGTYIDAPYCRYAEKRDIAGLALDEVILPGVVVDCRDVARERVAVEADRLPSASLAGQAVLFNFGWDRHWGGERYRSHPFIGQSVVDRLIADRAGLYGVDTGNADSGLDPASPVHSRLLAEDILICENLTGLGALLGRRFRFFAVPIKARGATSMTIRAFAELL